MLLEKHCKMFLLRLRDKNPPLVSSAVLGYGLGCVDSQAVSESRMCLIAFLNSHLFSRKKFILPIVVA
jgi:hypothetical protein